MAWRDWSAPRDYLALLNAAIYLLFLQIICDKNSLGELLHKKDYLKFTHFSVILTFLNSNQLLLLLLVVEELHESLIQKIHSNFIVQCFALGGDFIKHITTSPIDNFHAHQALHTAEHPAEL